MKKVLQALVLSLMLILQGTIPALAIPQDSVIIKDQNFFDAVKEYIQDNYYMEVNDQELYDLAIKGMLDGLDPYSQYMTKEEYKEFIGDTPVQSGIGVAIIRSGDALLVDEVIPGGPASKAGILKNDRIIAIESRQITANMTMPEIAALLQGAKNTFVNVTIMRNNQRLGFSIQREEVIQPTVTYAHMGGNKGYINIRSFNGKALSQVQAIMQEFADKKVDRIILDLRQNYGGILEEATEIGNYFVPAGKMMEISYRNRPSETVESTGLGKHGKLVVLVDDGTASASEMLAGAIQDTKSGVLVGEKTYGKGVIQSIYELKNGEAVKLTIGSYTLPSGRNIHKVGVTPDYKVPYQEIRTTNPYVIDTQIKKAMELLQ